MRALKSLPSVEPKPRTKDTHETYYTVTLENKEITIAWRRVPIGELRLDPKNQRIQYVVAQHVGRKVSEEQIEKILWKYDFVKDLYHSIEQNGGLIHPVAILGDGRVIEGNCRTVALRKLAQRNPGDARFALVPCEVFPNDLTEEQLTLLLGEWHIAGKHEWNPYEKAEYMYKATHLCNKTIDYLSYHLRVSRSTIWLNVKAYEMAKEFLSQYPNPENIQKFSYFLEFVKKKTLQTRLKNDPGFKQKFFSWVGDGKFDAGWQVRVLAAIIERPELEKKLDDEGFWAAHAALLQVAPSLASDLYRNVDQTVSKLRQAAASEIQELRKGNVAKVEKLRELYKAVAEIADLANFSLRD